MTPCDALTKCLESHYAAVLDMYDSKTTTGNKVVCKQDKM